MRPYDQPYKVLLLTCVVNCTAGAPMPRLCSVVQWSVHWAASRTTRVLILARTKRCALETCGEKKMQAPLLRLAKSIYYSSSFSGVRVTPKRRNKASVVPPEGMELGCIDPLHPEMRQHHLCSPEITHTQKS